MGSNPGSGRSPGEGNGNPFPYSYLEDSMDRGAWLAIAHVVTKKLDMTEHTCLSSWLKNVSHNLGEDNEVERDVYRCIHNIKHNYMLIFKIFKIFKISFRYFKLLLDHCRYKWFLYNIINHFVSDTVNKKMPNQIYTFWYMESRLNTIFYCTAE